MTVTETHPVDMPDEIRDRLVACLDRLGEVVRATIAWIDRDGNGAFLLVIVTDIPKPAVLARLKLELRLPEGTRMHVACYSPATPENELPAGDIRPFYPPERGRTVHSAEIEDPAGGGTVTVDADSVAELEARIDAIFGADTDSEGREIP